MPKRKVCEAGSPRLQPWGISQDVTSKGSIVVSSSGNSGINMNKVNLYPAESPYCLCVGAIWSDGKKSKFSNYGPPMDFCAPGEGLTIANSGGDKWFSDKAFGTSLAVPYISACAALVKMQYPGKTPAQIKSELIRRCVDYGVKGRDTYYGYGMPKFPLARPGGTSVTSAKWAASKKKYKVTTAWKTAAGATSYQVQIQSTPKVLKGKKNKYGKRVTSTVAVKAKKYTSGVTFTKNNKRYSTVKVRVRPWNKAGYGAWSSWRTVK